MPISPELRALEIDIPAIPDVLVKLSLLMAEDEIDLQRVGTLIEADMALASAIMRAVNSSLYGLKGRVQSVGQAITYLGTREVALITYAFGLRAAFPASPELEPIWQRAALRGALMGRLAADLDFDSWAAHSAGLFEECGKAVLLRHSRDQYAPMLCASRDDQQLCKDERLAFGVSHDALGAAMCASWGIGTAAVGCVRHHVAARCDGVLPAHPAWRDLVTLSVVCHALINDPEALDAVVTRVANQAALGAERLLRAARRLVEPAHAATRQ